MPRKKQWGFVFVDNHSNEGTLVKTIGHELGHGVYRLEHTFSERGLPRDQSGLPAGEEGNLMDYSNGRALYKYQWDFMHDPASVMTLFDDEEEGALDRCNWWQELYAYVNPSEIDLAIEAQLPLFDEVRTNYGKYFEDSKADNIEVSGFSGWTIRKASHTTGTGKQLVEKAILKLFEDTLPEIALHEKGVTLGTYTIEGREYQVAAFSVNGASQISKIEVDELCELAENEYIRVIATDDYVLVNFLKEGMVELTVMINAGGEETASKWLKYLSVLVENEEVKEVRRSFWEAWFDSEGEDEGEERVIYDYFIVHDDAWLRKTDAPYSFITPTQKATLGTQVSLTEVVQDDKGKDVAKLKEKKTGNSIFISLSEDYLAKVETLEKEIEYLMSADYEVLKVPYSIENGSKEYKKRDMVKVYQVCGAYSRIKSEDATMAVEGHWVETSVLRVPVSAEELALVDFYKAAMAGNVANDYEGFVADFKKDGYFTGNKEPLTWMKANGIDANEVDFLGMKVTKIITPFKEVLEQTEKNLKNDYPDAYNEIVAQYSGTSSLLGRAQIRYIANSCVCNPSNHSLGAAIDIRDFLSPQITSADKEYVTFIKYLTGLDLTEPKTDQEAVEAQEKFMMKIHGQKTKKYDLSEIVADYEDAQALTSEFALLASLKDQDILIENFQDVKQDLVDILNAHKNRLIFETDAKAAIEAMVTYLQSVSTGNVIARKVIANWDKVNSEKEVFLKMVKECGLNDLNDFTTYFGYEKGRTTFKNKLLENGFGESKIELVNSFHKAHQTISKNYNIEEKGEWGGSYRDKYDGMHFGLKSSFIKALTNKQ